MYWRAPPSVFAHPLRAAHRSDISTKIAGHIDAAKS